MLQYRFGPGSRVTAVYPDTCKNGHRHEPRKVTIGWSTPYAWICCDRCYDEGREGHTIYLLEPSHEEFVEQWRRWKNGKASGGTVEGP